jgi:hypothetical protein
MEQSYRVSGCRIAAACVVFLLPGVFDSLNIIGIIYRWSPAGVVSGNGSQAASTYLYKIRRAPLIGHHIHPSAYIQA